MSTRPGTFQERMVAQDPTGSGSTRRERALRWLSESGIIVSGAGPAGDGAVYSFFDAHSGRYRLVYAEGTGYLLSLWKHLRTLKQDHRLDGQARVAADWLVRWTDEHGDAVAMGLEDGVPIRQAYAFDGGICAKGLLDAYEVTGDSRYVETAGRILRRLLANSVNDDGSVTPALDLDSGRFLEPGKVWFSRSGAFHGKLSMPLLHLSAVTGDDSLREAARRICAWTVTQQAGDGSFPANVAMRSVNLHAHCYATEALLYAHAMLGTPAFRDAAERAVRWIVNRQSAHGSVGLWHGGRKLRRRASYAMAQSIRLFLLLDALARRDGRIDAATRMAAFLARMQAWSADPRVDGGFYSEDIVRSGIFIRKNREVTSWATMFAIQALDFLGAARELSFEQCITCLF